MGHTVETGRCVERLYSWTVGGYGSRIPCRRLWRNHSACVRTGPNSAVGRCNGAGLFRFDPDREPPSTLAAVTQSEA
jgi:hypothetical protein